MNAFYNLNGVGDTLLLFKHDLQLDDRAFSKHGDVVRIYHKQSKEVSGYNIFNASNYGTINGNGPLEWNNELEALVEKAFKENQIDSKALTVEEKIPFVIGYVESKEKHENADKLSVCQVNIGTETLQIVCGAPNVEAGQKVVVACVGAVMPSGLKIKKAKLRGVESTGMICSAKELNLPNAPEEKGILVLDESVVVGAPFEQ
ncbi:YtpR family tRNA-binding protein [Alkalihalobacillus sp. 1P02AB]|uniref:YtpR family tRNA-binding protein n=1 Tax=Alkalihalobacillus sp. 1P02AB TaxID=3132260 RepID=UPI0039A56621